MKKERMRQEEEETKKMIKETRKKIK